MKGNIPYISREQTEELLNCFNEAIENPESKPLLFNVWGIGGAGKTTLLDRLKEQQPNLSFARVYFGSTPDISTPFKLMANLYRQLPAIDDWGQDCEIFTDLYQKYEQILKQLKQPDKKESEAQATARKEALKKLVGGSAKTISQATPLKNIPGAEDKIGSIAEGGVDLFDWLQKQRVTKKDKELQKLILKPIPKLTEAFVRGLIAKSKQKPVVLLLDTYEKTDSGIDDWLWQYLIANLDLKSHSVRLVVAGRNNLLKRESWRKLQQDLDIVYSLEIEKFTDEQTQNYLEQIGIDESEQIFQVTKGLPYYLDWIRKQKLAGKKLDFSQGNQEIVNLLLQGLNKEQKKIIQLAACCRWFDRSLIKYLVTNQDLNFDNAVYTKLNCFEWLEKLDFVEFAQNKHRLDDVARDVFRLSLWQEDKDRFCQVNHLLAKYYEDKAIEEVPPDSSPPQIYENLEWKYYTAESLYHAFFAREQDWEREFLSHLFTACYLQETEVIEIPFNAITAEINIGDNVLLSSSVKIFLQSIKPIFDVNCLAFEKQKLANSLLNELLEDFFVEDSLSEKKSKTIIQEYNLKEQLNKLLAKYKINNSFDQVIIPEKYVLYLLQEFLLEKTKIMLEPALEYCFKQIDFLDGLAKFVALLYKAKHSPSSYQLNYLQQAKFQADKIIAIFYWENNHSLLFSDKDFLPFVKYLGLNAVPIDR